ncbi:MAG: putative protein YpbG [Fimbriimonadaceae bacterium]|nr:putative protein YpbG [Fimbriimonadaceae bacterium]
MKPAAVAAAAVGAGLGLLLYGSLVEWHRLTLTKRILTLPRWPEPLNGFRIAILSDFHLRDRYTVDLTRRAVEMAMDADPDVIAMPGDFVGYWKADSDALLWSAMSELRSYRGRVVAVPGNHDYWAGTPERLEPVFADLGITLLRNENVSIEGVRWIGIDSFNQKFADPDKAFSGAGDPLEAKIVLWHEPDVVDQLPEPAALMLSGHTHGGQFVTPWGWPPIRTRNGEKYLRGFFEEAETPLFVTSGIGTTGPPSRWNCPPEVAVLTLFSSSVLAA